MGRLFWKFFAFVWLAQMAGIIAVGSLFWLTSRRTEAAFNDLAAAPMADAAAEVLRYGGTGAFRAPRLRPRDLREGLGRPGPRRLRAPARS